MKTSARRAALWALVAALCAASAAPAFAERRVVVDGNRVFEDGEVIALARQGGWKPDQGTDGLSALQEAYYREGYLRASFEVGLLEPVTPDSAVVLFVEEGPIARYGRVHVKGAHVRDQGSILNSLGISPSAEFVPRLLDRRIAALLRSYDEQGYPFVQVWIDSLSFDQSRDVVDLSLFVVEGRERTLENVAVEGSQQTRPDLVVRMSGLEPGRPYQGEMLRDAYLRLKSSGVFNDVSYPKLRVSSDGLGVDAVLVVEESRRSNSFAAVLGYAAAEDGEGDQLSGFVRLSLNNIGGTLKDVHAFWTNDGRGRSETRLQYRDRFFLGRLVSAGFILEQVGQDTLYTWQSAGIEAGRPAGRLGRNLVSFSAGLHADRNVFSEGALLRSWRYRFRAGVTLVRGDPRKRTFAELNTTFTLAKKKSHFRNADVTESLYQYILDLEGEGSVGLMRSLSLYMGLVYRGLQSREALVPLSEQFYIGGARTLRGYRENQFHSRRVATARNELRIGPSPNENLYLFIDVGYILQESGSLGPRDLFKAGYGFGLRTRSQIGIVGLSFGVGDEVSLGQAKVHILLEQNF
jgi:outer membrane protein insertion porin family